MQSLLKHLLLGIDIKNKVTNFREISQKNYLFLVEEYGRIKKTRHRKFLFVVTNFSPIVYYICQQTNA